MKKFQSLGRVLGKQEQKKIMGGVLDPGDTKCTSDGDCPSGNISCPDGTTKAGTPKCDLTKGQCRLVGVCIS
jgi:hypothetical protein